VAFVRSAADKTNRLTSDENITSLAKVINEKEKLKKTVSVQTLAVLIVAYSR